MDKSLGGCEAIRFSRTVAMMTIMLSGVSETLLAPAAHQGIRFFLLTACS
ncbi:hypothetical protein O23A_p1235 [Aeromonas salmonicida]|nr:hypothetical protein O23A_p1235 [Aeromonas salmonicida]